ncbi:hydroxyacid dehydrogenase [Arthrobacter sp. ISL-30]|uniref:hydroxyacid dehydrogenase n=1 Tax=Arthrobacter sp. ISL-30 TaxID=2819109 RepID=UPI001BE81C43|nr:hydroxyacid dehydrogenase [Arthrobacter sp. ISL-30]MBT2515515.1 hydroxyacid dehydrogenase [Arthrobacter sp. ISL-30]
MTSIYISDPIHADVLADVQAAADVVHLGFGPEKVDYLAIADSVDGIILRTETFTREMIEASPKLKIIARHGVGTDNVDLAAASDNGVWVTVTPNANSNAVAEYVFALLLSAARKTGPAVELVRSKVWSDGKAGLVGFELSGRTLGIVGFGAIGRRVAAIGQGFGMNIIVSDPIAHSHDVAKTGAALVELETLLRESDVITVHAPLLPSTHHMISRHEIARMKKNAFIINTSRGGLIDEEALVEGLESGAIAGAALDVLEAESVDMKNPLQHNTLPLGSTAGLVVTPHIAGQTEDSLRAMGSMSWAEVRTVLDGVRPQYPVNADNIRITQAADA